MAVAVVEGEAGCLEAGERGAIAVVVDALRTSATLPWLFARGVKEVYAATSLREVHALRERFPNALLAGEQGGAPIPGFDLGNSPAELERMRPDGLEGRVVLFASSSGSRRLVQAAGAAEVVVGSPVNARAMAYYVSRRAAETGRDVLVIAAGHPDGQTETPEDTWAAVYLASLLEPDLLPERRDTYDKWLEEVVRTGLGRLFRQSPNGKRLGKLGYAGDVALAAAPNSCPIVPVGAELVEHEGRGSALRLVAAALPHRWIEARL